jgi:hypothetical protein
VNARKLRPLLILIVIACAVPTVLSTTGLADKRDRTYKKRNLESTRKLDIKYEDDYQYEATFEKCEIQSIDQLAKTLHVPARPAPVARAYARHHAPMYREAVFRGCRDAYLEHWNPPSDGP